MIAYNSVETMAMTFQLSYDEAQEVAGLFPGYLAEKLANKFVETHWKTISKDKKLMAEIKRLTINRSVALLADLIEQKVSKSLGIEEDNESTES